MTNYPKWTKHSSKIVHSNNWFKVQKDKVTRPNGEKSEYNIVISPPAVFIIAKDEDNNIYLVGQFRYAIQRYSLEIPAGSTDNQPLLKAAKRELEEETGLIAGSWEELGSFYSANGLLREKAHVFLATGLQQTGEDKKSEDGIDKVIKLPIKRVLEMIKDGEIHDGQTISSLMLYFSRSNRIKP